jgi:hypothetical protein
MTSDKNLGEMLSDLTTEHGISLDKLSELTNIPKRYLSAIVENDSRNMPAAPYVLGYVTKICSTLGVEAKPFHDAYRKAGLKTSGKEDYLPKNRFAITKKKKGWIFATAISIIVVFLIVPRLDALLGIPSIEINLPAKVEDRDFLETRDQLFVISGKINPKDSIIINKELIPTDGEGGFSKEVLLNTGLNAFEIKVKRFLGREITVIRKIFYITEDINEINNNINGEEIYQEDQEQSF